MLLLLLPNFVLPGTIPCGLPYFHKLQTNKLRFKCFENMELPL